MSPDSTGGHRSTTPTDAIASARTCSIVSAIVAGSGPVVRARSVRSAATATIAHVVSPPQQAPRRPLGARSPQVTARFREPTRSSDRRRRVRSARLATPLAALTVGKPASSGLVGRVANVTVLCALPTSTDDGCPAFTLHEPDRPTSKLRFDVDTARRELDQHRVVDANNVGLTIRCRPHRTQPPATHAAPHADGSGTRHRPLWPADTNPAHRTFATHHRTRCAPRSRSAHDRAVADPTLGWCDADTESPTHPPHPPPPHRRDR